MRPAAETIIIEVQWLSTYLDDLAIDAGLTYLVQRVLDPNVDFNLAIQIGEPA